MLRDTINILAEQKSFFLILLKDHLRISLTAIVLAAVIGLFLGILISEHQKHSRWVLGLVNIVYTIPSISLLGFLIPLSGIGNKTAILALTIYALLPMVRNTHTGIININPGIIEAARGMGSSPQQILFRIKLPLAMPVIMSGVRNMVTMTVALAGIASFIGAGGLGVAIYRGITTNNMALTVAGSLLIALLALALDLLFGRLEKRLEVGQRRGKDHKFIYAFAGLLALILVFSFFGKANKDKTINIATKPMTEQYIIGELLRFYIEQETPYQVNLIDGVGGGTSNIQPGMESGQFDLYPEYTGTGWNMVLKKSGIYQEDQFDELVKGYEDGLDMTWRGMYGFNNTFGLAIRRDIAETYHIKTYSDVKAIAGDLTFGAEYDFYEREDGFNALCNTYGFQFNKTIDLDIGLKYKAINNKEIDIMTIFTTDGQLAKSDVEVLEDDLHFYPSYQCGHVVTLEALEKFPELEGVLSDLEGIIDDNTMAELNYQVESENMDPANVAEIFLKSHNMWRD